MNKRFLIWILILLAVGLVFLLITHKKPIPEDQKTYCAENQRNVEACIQIYQPVCGHTQVECIKEPCDLVPETYSNSCVACSNERVEFYLDGEC